MLKPRSVRADLTGAIISGLTVVLFCLILLWRDPLLFWNDDYQLSILPVFADIARSWSEGHLPLLSPYSWVCSNLAGEYQYGTFSIFVNAAVILIWKFPLTFAQQAAALSITHLFVLAAGAFMLAHDRLRLGETVETPLPQSSHLAALQRGTRGGGRGSRVVSELSNASFSLSILVALVAALNGWIICWGATDWFGALGAFAWFPWAWWALERSLKNTDLLNNDEQPLNHHKQLTMHRKRLMMQALWPAPLVYLVVTGGFPYTVLMLLLLAGWLALRTLVETRSLLSILPMLGGLALGFALSAPAWLAIFDYVHGSARDMQAASAHWQWIVPPAALPALILPCWTVNWADFSTRYVPHSGTEMACGLIAPVALIAGLVTRGRLLVRQIGWELGLLALVLMIAMLPSAGVFRWSFRWLPFFHLILALCAAETLRNGIGFPRHAVASREGGQPMFTGKMPVPRSSLIAILVVGVIAISMSLLRTTGDYAFPLTWIFLALVAVWVVAEFLGRDAALRRPNRHSSSEQRSALSLHVWAPSFITFIAFLATYLCIPPNCGVPKYNLSAELTRPGPLDPQRLYLSVYPPAEHAYRMEKKPGPVGQIVRPGSTSMCPGLHFINGYSPILAAGVAREFNFAIHGEIDSELANYLLAQQGGTDGQLAKLGIDGIAIAREVDVAPAASSHWQLVAETDEGRVFHRPGSPFPRVRSVTSIDSRTEERFAIAMVSRIYDSRNRVELDVDVPSGGRNALLTFSRPYFSGYEVRIDRKKLTVDSYRGLFPIVEIPAGARGRLVLSYRPWWLIYGGGLSIASAIFFIAALVIAARGKKARHE